MNGNCALKKIDQTMLFCNQDIDLELCDHGSLAGQQTGVFLFWTERHPELGTFEESFPNGAYVLAPAEEAAWKNFGRTYAVQPKRIATRKLLARKPID